MVAISSGKSRGATNTKSKRIRVLLLLVLLLIVMAIIFGFVLQNLQMSIVQQQHENNSNNDSNASSHLGLRNSYSIPSDHAHLLLQQQQEQKQKQAEPDDDGDDTEETDVVKEGGGGGGEEEAPEKENDNALDDDDGDEDADEEGGDEAEAEGENATEEPQEEDEGQEKQGAGGGGDDGNNQGDDNVDGMRQEEEEQGAADAICPYGSLSELTKAERYPRKNALGADGSLRHMVDPPPGGKVALVCCMTTVGPWNFVIRHAWAPKGAQRVQTMVETGYFGNQKVPLMRCVHDFLCQFGLAGPVSKEFDSPTLPDDPNWLPEGPDFRQDATTGVKRFATGYLAYAGAGPHSRGVQLIVALAANGPLGGGSPWEVPWGETVGVHSFETLSQIYTGYGEKGPSQALLHREGASENVAKQFPKLDYINSCQIVDEEEQSPGDEEMVEEE